jgi:hypothetical protein
MKQSPEFIGQHYNQEERETLKEVLSVWAEESGMPVEGELEKDPKEIKTIEVINSVIGMEMKSLGIEGYEPMPLQNIHILSEEQFNKLNSPDLNACYIATSDVIYLNRDARDNYPHFVAGLIHEIIHRTSAQRFYLDENDSVSGARVGYRLHSPWKTDLKRIDRLRGFNELMTDFTVYKILLKYNEVFEQELGITLDDTQTPIFTYMHYGPILESIVKKVEGSKNISGAEAFVALEKGLFDSSILALKVVDRMFGKGSVEVLSYLELYQDNVLNSELEERIKEYFEEPDENKRKYLGDKIRLFVAIHPIETADKKR